MPAHPPFRLRLTLAFLILALAGTAFGAAMALGTGQEPPATVTVATVAPTGPPLDLAAIQADLEATGVVAAPEMRLGVLDKDQAIQAIRAERRARRDAQAQEALADQQAAILEYAAALDAADQAADVPPPITTAAPVPQPVPQPQPQPVPDDDGNLSLYEKLDNIAMCESNQNPAAYNPQGPWYGAFQFRRDTWETYGGGPRDIRRYSYVQQREIAANLARARGFAGSWPTCAARYGYA